jgi:hypothetical protein
MKGVVSSGIIITLFIALIIQLTSAARDELYFIDAHSQVDHKVVPLNKVISLMKQGGVSQTLLSARGKLKGNALRAFASQYPEYITPAVRTKGRPYETGSAKYYELLEAQVASRGFSAMAEVLLYHAQKAIKLRSMWSIQRMKECAPRSSMPLIITGHLSSI